MERQIYVQSKSLGRFLLFAVALIATGCANSATNAGTASTLSSTSASSTLVISPSSVTLTPGTTYNFSASGGSGSGYTFSMYTGSTAIGSISTSGYYYAGTSTSGGTDSVLVTDSAGNVAYASVSITSTSTTSSSVLSITGTLTNCVGVTGGSFYENNWQANGTELRTISDQNYFQESPVNCSGLSVAGQIPATATIQGISVGVFLINQTSVADGSLLESMSLINSNSVIGTASLLNSQIPGNTATFPTFTEGSSSNLWGATLTPAIVNSSTFGISMQTYRTYNRLFTGNAASNMPQVTIYYSL